ncbi:hypothetical protein B0H13DRAFT_1650864, partial [Mycena leptocephala]
GLSDSEPFYKLLSFLGPNWLSGSHQNDMLELLRRKVDNNPDLSKKIRIQGVALASKIVEAHKAGSDTYRTARGFRWLRNVADDLVRNQAALVSSAHLGEINDQPHWIGLIFGFSSATAKLLYGDSFGELIPASLLAASRWWISEHTGTQFVLDKLPIGPQTDSFSCSMLVDNSLQHFIDPGVPLHTSTETYVNPRLETFNKVGKWALERVSFCLLSWPDVHCCHSLKL